MALQLKNIQLFGLFGGVHVKPICFLTSVFLLDSPKNRWKLTHSLFLTATSSANLSFEIVRFTANQVMEWKKLIVEFLRENSSKYSSTLGFIIYFLKIRIPYLLIINSEIVNIFPNVFIDGRRYNFRLCLNGTKYFYLNGQSLTSPSVSKKIRQQQKHCRGVRQQQSSKLFTNNKQHIDTNLCQLLKTTSANDMEIGGCHSVKFIFDLECHSKNFISTGLSFIVENVDLPNFDIFTVTLHSAIENLFHTKYEYTILNFMANKINAEIGDYFMPCYLVQLKNLLLKKEYNMELVHHFLYWHTVVSSTTPLKIHHNKLSQQYIFLSTDCQQTYNQETSLEMLQLNNPYPISAQSIIIFLLIKILFQVIQSLFELNFAKINIFIFAHNGGRFDHILLSQHLIKVITFWPAKIYRIMNLQYFQNNGAMLSLDFDVCNDTQIIHFALRDSLKYTPTLSKSLAGATSELKLPLNKMPNDYRIMDFLFYKLNTKQIYKYWTNEHWWQKNVAKQLFTFLSPVIGTHNNVVENEIDFDIHFNEKLFDNRIYELCNKQFLCQHFFVLYLQFDVLILAQLLNYIEKEIVFTNFYSCQTIPFMYRFRSIPSVAFHELMFVINQHGLNVKPHHRSMKSKILKTFCVDPNNKEKHQIFAPTRSTDMYIRKSVYGGRCQSSIIGSLPLELTKKEQNLLFGQLKETIFRLGEIFQSKFEIKNINDLQYHLRRNNFAMLSEELQYALHVILEKTSIHIDICSMYPSALNSPLPLGEIQKLTAVQITCLNKLIASKKFNPYKVPFFITFVKLEMNWENIEQYYNDCSLHCKIQYPPCPKHYDECYGDFDDDPQKFYRQKSGLLWTYGRIVYGIYNSLDIFNLTQRNNFHGTILYNKTLAPFEYGLYFDGGWDSKAMRRFFQHAFNLKAQGAKEGNIGKKTCGKLIMNSSYGQCLTNVSDKFIYRLDDNKNAFEQNKQIMSEIQAPEDMSEFVSTYTAVNNETTHKMFLTAQSNATNSQAQYKPLQIGSLCLAGSRIMFDQMLGQIIDGITIYTELYQPKCTANLRATYADTDSLTASTAACLFGIPNPNGGNLGSMNEKTCLYNFDITFESCQGDYCSFWFNNFQITFPCFVSNLVFAKKSYVEVCLFCHQYHIRSKAHTNDDFVQSICGLNTTPNYSAFIQVLKYQLFQTHFMWQLLKSHMSENDSFYHQYRTLWENTNLLQLVNIFTIPIFKCFIMETKSDTWPPKAFYNFTFNMYEIANHINKCPHCQYFNSNLLLYYQQKATNSNLLPHGLNFIHHFVHTNKFFSLHDTLQTTRFTMKITMPKMTQAGHVSTCWSITPATLQRGIFIQQDKNLIPCSKCHQYLTDPYQKIYPPYYASSSSSQLD